MDLPDMRVSPRVDYIDRWKQSQLAGRTKVWLQQAVIVLLRSKQNSRRGKITVRQLR